MSARPAASGSTGFGRALRAAPLRLNAQQDLGRARAQENAQQDAKARAAHTTDRRGEAVAPAFTPDSESSL